MLVGKSLVSFISVIGFLEQRYKLTILTSFVCDLIYFWVVLCLQDLYFPTNVSRGRLLAFFECSMIIDYNV